MRIVEFKCADCGWVEDRSFEWDARVPEKRFGHCSVCLADWESESTPPMSRFDRVWSFAVGRVAGAGDTPGRAS